MTAREITVQRLSAGTVFKLVGIGLACSIIPLSLLTGLLSMSGAATTMMVNRHMVTGVSALVVSPLMGALTVLLLTMLLGSGMAFGLWLFSKFRPMRLLVTAAPSSGPAGATPTP
jgi:hypothetical protein